METQQMMELLLARFNAIMKEHLQEMMATMDANIAEMKADRKAYHKEMMVCLGRTEVGTEETEPVPGMMQVHRGASRDPQGRSCSDVGRRTEEMA
jgi:hypothetical protein